MTKKAFQLIAQAVADENAGDVRSLESLAFRLARDFRDDNPRFRTTLFLEACGLPYWVIVHSSRMLFWSEERGAHGDWTADVEQATFYLADDPMIVALPPNGEWLSYDGTIRRTGASRDTSVGAS